MCRSTITTSLICMSAWRRKRQMFRLLLGVTAIVFHAFVFIMMMCTVASSRLKAGWLGIVAALALLLNFGLSEFMWKYLHMAMTLVMYQVASTMIAFEIFLVLIDEVLSPRREADAALATGQSCPARQRSSSDDATHVGGRSGFAGTLQSEARAFRRQRPASIVGAGGICDRILLLLGIRSGESDGTRLVFLSPLNLAVSETAAQQYSPLVNQLLEWGLPSRVAVLLYLIVALCGRMAFLLPFAVYALATTAVDRDLRLLLGGTALAGVGLLVLIEAVVPQEIWAFYWFADIALALLGVAGLKAMWSKSATNASPDADGNDIGCGTLCRAGMGFLGRIQRQARDNLFPDGATDLPGCGRRRARRNAIENNPSRRCIGHRGSTLMIDDRTLAAGVVGLQLYASRIILPVYAARTKVAEQVASRMWLLDDDLALASSRQRIRDDVGPGRSLYLLWLGIEMPTDMNGITQIAAWPEMSLWRVD